MKKLFVVLLVMGILVWGFSGVGWGGIVEYIDFQGKLTPRPVDTTVVWFKIFDVESGGLSIWDEKFFVKISYTGSGDLVVDTNGVFSVKLGSTAGHLLTSLSFDMPYWVQIEVGGTPLSPRQALTAAPYAFNAKNVIGDGTIYISRASEIAVRGETGSNFAVWGRKTTIATDANAAVYGQNDRTFAADNPGVKGQSTSGYGVYGKGAAAKGGVVGTTLTTAPTITNFGVYGESASGYGVWGTGGHGVGARSSISGRGGVALEAANTHATDGWGVYGSGSTRGVIGETTATSGIGVNGVSYATTGGIGVKGDSSASDAPGVFGTNSSAGSGVRGDSTSGTGVAGDGLLFGVYGLTTGTDVNSTGVGGYSGTGPGVWGASGAAGRPGVYGSNTSTGTGVRGDSTGGNGVSGVHTGSNLLMAGVAGAWSGDLLNTPLGYLGTSLAGVAGFNKALPATTAQGYLGAINGVGVYGKGNTMGVSGESTSGIGVFGGISGTTGIAIKGVGGGTAVYGESSGFGVYGKSSSPTTPAVFAWNTGGGPALEISGYIKTTESYFIIFPATTSITLPDDKCAFIVSNSDSTSRWIPVTNSHLSASSIILVTNQKGNTAIGVRSKGSGTFELYMPGNGEVACLLIY
jgi:hypothetical protein